VTKYGARVRAVGTVHNLDQAGTSNYRNILGVFFFMFCWPCISVYLS